jgi:hypothetical protein
MNNFDVMTRPTDAAAVLDAYASAVNTVTAVGADHEDGPVDEAAATEETEETEAAEVTEVDRAADESTTGSMARLLELAASNADELMAEAHAEAEELTASARDEADRLLAEARLEAEQVRADSARERQQAEDEIADLRRTGADHLTLMRDHLQGLLDKVETADLA